MTETEYLLACLVEEASEAVCLASKALRFGPEEVLDGQPYTNAERLAGKLVDLGVIQEMLHELGILPEFTTSMTKMVVAAQEAKIKKHMDVSRELGALTTKRQC